MAASLFRWEHFADRLLRPIAEAAGLPQAGAAGALEERYGVPPGEDFVTDALPVLLDVWLKADRASAAVIAARLREQGLGDRHNSGTSAAALLHYLRSCEPSPPLPGIVLVTFLAAGAAPTSAGARNPRRRSRGKVEGQFRVHVEGLVRGLLGVDELAVGPDAEIRLPHDRVLSTVDDPPKVRIASLLVRGAVRNPELLERLNDLNTEFSHTRIFVTAQGDVTLALDLRGPDVSVQDLTFGVDLLDRLSDSLGEDLQSGFGRRSASPAIADGSAYV